MLISLIVPCYNEEEAMPLFYQEAARVAAQMEKSHGAEFEIIFVDDGSKDGTLRVARELHDAERSSDLRVCVTFPSAAILARKRAFMRA